MLNYQRVLFEMYISCKYIQMLLSCRNVFLMVSIWLLLLGGNGEHCSFHQVVQVASFTVKYSWWMTLTEKSGTNPWTKRCCHYSSHFNIWLLQPLFHDWWGISFRYFSWLSAHFSQTISASSQRKWSHTATAKHMVTTASTASTASTATTATRTASTWSLPVMALRRRWGAHVENIIWDVWDVWDVYTFNTTSFNIP